MMGGVYVAIVVVMGATVDVIVGIILPFTLAAVLTYGTFAAVLAAVLYLELRRVKEGPGAEEIAKSFD